MRTLLAFRHAEAEVNRPDLFVPGADDRTYPLTATGIAQARSAGNWAIKTFDWVREGAYIAAVSQFIRTQQTYQFMGLPKTPPLIHPELNEQDWGDFMSANPPERLRVPFDTEYITHIGVKAPHGESTLDLYTRLQSALDDLIADDDSNIVIVAHGRALLIMRMIIEGIPPSDAGWRFLRQNVSEMPNCGVLLYPDICLPPGDKSSGRVTVLDPPYLSAEYFSWQPFLGTVFKADAA